MECILESCVPLHFMKCHSLISRFSSAELSLFLMLLASLAFDAHFVPISLDNGCFGADIRISFLLQKFDHIGLFPGMSQIR